MMPEENYQDLEASMQLAHFIEVIKMYAIPMDAEYIKSMANQFIEQGNRQDAMMVLNPGHPLEKNKLLKIQGYTLMKLYEFIQLLKECEDWKQKVKLAEENKNAMQNFFI
jgi:hypothetical protein